MATLAAATMPDLFRAIVPISGYQYDLGAITPAGGSVASRRAVPMFMHHSRDDPMVRFGGCCAAQEGECCCGISNRGPSDGKCTGADAGFREWARDVNGCGGDGVSMQTRPLTSMGDVELAGDAIGGGGSATVRGEGNDRRDATLSGGCVFLLPFLFPLPPPLTVCP